jgi:hypothetical protein
MLPGLEPLKFARASNLYVRLKSFDGETPVVVTIERKTIDGLFGLSSSTDKQRVNIVMSNLAAIFDIVKQRHGLRSWTEATINCAKVRQMVLSEEDFHDSNLVLPRERTLTRRR